MKSYICYIHTPNSLTPQMRVVTVGHDRDVPEAILDALEEWPHFEVIDVYNERDEAILHLAAGDGPRAVRH